MVGEIWFYHLERSSLETVLPALLERTMGRGWRALVRADDDDLLKRLDDHLWTYRPDSFLAHGRADEPHAAEQPVVLTRARENPNGAQALFIVDGADLAVSEEFERCFILFDGNDEMALAAARDRWKTLKADGGELQYWKQDGEGRWARAA